MEFPIIVGNKTVLVQVNKAALLGRGAFAEVYEGLMFADKDHPTKVAVKLFNETAVQNKLSGPNSFWKELQSIVRLSHENIIKMHGFNKDKLCIVMEYANGGTLESAFTKHEIRKLMLHDKATLYTLARDITLGLLYMHSHGCLHLDLHARNILLIREGNTIVRAVIGDLGIARFKETYILTPAEYPNVLPQRCNTDGTSCSNSSISSSLYDQDVRNLVEVLGTLFMVNRSFLESEDWLSDLEAMTDTKSQPVYFPEVADVLRAIEVTRSSEHTEISYCWLLQNYLDVNYPCMLASIPPTISAQYKVLKMLMKFVLFHEFPFNIRQAAKIAILYSAASAQLKFDVMREIFRESCLTSLDTGMYIELVHYNMRKDPMTFFRSVALQELERIHTREIPRTPTILHQLMFELVKSSTSLTIQPLLMFFMRYIMTDLPCVQVEYRLEKVMQSITSKLGFENSDFVLKAEMDCGIISQSLFIGIQGFYQNYLVEFEQDKTVFRSWMELSLLDGCIKPMVHVFIVNVYTLLFRDIDALIKIIQVLDTKYAKLVRINAAKAISFFEGDEILLEVAFSHLVPLALDPNEREMLRVQALRSMNKIAFRAGKKLYMMRELEAIKKTTGGQKFLDTVNDVDADLELWE